MNWLGIGILAFTFAINIVLYVIGARHHFWWYLLIWAATGVICFFTCRKILELSVKTTGVVLIIYTLVATIAGVFQLVVSSYEQWR